MFDIISSEEAGMDLVASRGNSESPAADGNRIRLAPGRAFGSGDHATTVLCLEMIQAYIKRGHAFLDVGTGTGILMIAAARLGADHVTGFDRDPSAVAAARYNLSLNGIDRERASVVCAAHPDLLKARFDLVAINILPETIVAFMDGMARMLKPDGVLVCSGMIRGNTHRVTGALKQGGLTPVRTFQKGAWMGIAARQS